MMEQDIWPESFCKTRRMEQQKYLGKPINGFHIDIQGGFKEVALYQ